MCGIAGVLAPPVAAGALEDHLRSMIATLRHRGPDGEGVWHDGRAGLAHARLAIIDLSPAAAQPMSDEDGVVHVVHNGEVFNFPALREELIGLGHRFRSRSDTEVIVNGYKQWGEAVVARLRGQFAFALWDARARRLLLARDRLGQKPLYYMRHQGALLFGSEAKAILAWPGVARTADLAAIDRYLTFGHVPAPGSAFAGMKRLPAAHYMVVEDGGAARIERYWSLPEPEAARPRPLPELREELRARLDEAVRLRLMSDVPLGAFLSGGVDSAAVVASMARASGAPVKTFTIGFDDAAYDERAYARMVADHIGTEHHEFVVRPDAQAILPKLVWHYGEPYADSSALPTWYVSEITRQHVTVALNGDGGDEEFLGYPRYVGGRIAALLDRLPSLARRALAAFGRTLPFAASENRKLRYIRRFLADLDRSGAERYLRWLAYYPDEMKQSLYGDALQGVSDGPAHAPLAPWLDGHRFDAGRIAHADLHCSLPDDLLVKVDIATMAHGLEGRSPFLDHELMEFAATIPVNQKMTWRETKSLLKSAVVERLPRAAVYRPKKGFEVPIDRWLRGEMREMAYDTLLSTRARERGLLRPEAVRRLLDDHVSGRGLNQHRIWALLMLELWFVMWIDPAQSPARP